ncbi:MAG TPA: hypothetical protein VGO55_01675 [Allosphingosinicella sp.]|nr:hypothetical protein [Allosphingosinicella sp.]
MSKSCGDGKHVALARPIRNQAFDFGRCRKCGRDLVRSRRAWRTVPAGFRVVWRREPPGTGQASAAQLKLALNLPENRLAPVAGRGQPRLAATVELVLLGMRGLAAAMAERTRLWLKTRPERRVAIAGALGPPSG